MATISLGSTRLGHTSEDKKTAVLKAAEQFYVALNALFTGEVAPMKEVWSHAEDVTYMGPGGGFQIGWTQVLASWEEQAAMKLGGKVTPDRMQITIGKDIALTHNYEIGENVDKDGNTKKVSIRATNVFRKEGGLWKMIGHHTDLLPYLEKNAQGK
ncbi:MAG: nuclear transport factor 2 family protein [Chlamydiae bacterium]|nr:nuclear transport factor 2 family protein [Chlamydiota bacterium]MBI3265623.1 nuclear transport factor 2 family protein [Chlamydiota bacterium]